MARAVTRCPGCGERVSPFAAGCAICGTDLEPARMRAASRARLAPTPLRLASAPRRTVLARQRWLRDHGGLDPIHLVIALVVAIAAPPFGLLLSVFWAVQRYRAGETLMAAAMSAVALLAGAAFFAPVWFWTLL